MLVLSFADENFASQEQKEDEAGSVSLEAGSVSQEAPGSVSQEAVKVDSQRDIFK